MEKTYFTGSKCAHYGKSLYKVAPIRFFTFVWGLPAGAEDPPLCTIPRFDLSKFANRAEFSVFGLGDWIHPGVIIFTSKNQNYCIIFVHVIILEICRSAALARNMR